MQQVALNHSAGEIAWWDHISIHAHLLTTYLLYFFLLKQLSWAYVILFNLGSSSKFQSHSLWTSPTISSLYLPSYYHSSCIYSSTYPFVHGLKKGGGGRQGANMNLGHMCLLNQSLNAWRKMKIKNEEKNGSSPKNKHDSHFSQKIHFCSHLCSHFYFYFSEKWNEKWLKKW